MVIIYVNEMTYVVVVFFSLLSSLLIAKGKVNSLQEADGGGFAQVKGGTGNAGALLPSKSSILVSVFAHSQTSFPLRN